MSKLSDHVAEEKKPATFQEALKQTVTGRNELSAADQAALDGRAEVPLRPMDPEQEDEEGMLPPEARANAPAPVGEEGDDIPPWFVVPPNFKFPPRKQLIFVKLEAAWTDYPAGGDRHCLMWNLSDSDEKWALKRTVGDSSRTLAELTKQMIRVIDGETVDWTKGHVANVHRWWNEIGSKCRQQLMGLYHKTHNLDREEQRHFFANCVKFRSIAGT